MARALGPDEAYRLVYFPGSGATGAGLIGRLYLDAEGTIAPDLLDLDGNPVPVVSGAAQRTIDAYSKWPRIQYPSGVDTIYGSVNGGPIVPLVADLDSRIDTLAPLQPSGDITGVTDTAAIAAADAAGVVAFGPGTFWTTGLTKQAGTIWQGAGRQETVIKLAAGANRDVVQGANFSTLTGTGSTSGGIGGWGIRDLSIDGNKAAQSGTSWGLRVYGYGFDVTNVSIHDCLSGGMYTEWADFGGASLPDKTMESIYSGIKIHDCSGPGWQNRGPHDSRAVDVTIFNNSASAYGYWGEANTATTVAAGSNGVDVSTFAGAGTLQAATTVGYATAGSLTVTTATGARTVTYTGKTGSAFTGCTATAPGGSTVSTGAAVAPVGAYSAAGTLLIGCHVWGSPLWDYVLDAQTHLIGCIGEVSAAGGGQVLIRAGQCEVVGGLYVIYSGFTANGCGIQLGDSVNAATGARVDTTLSGFTGADAAHAALNIVNDGGTNTVDALVYQPSGLPLYGTPNVGYSRYRIQSSGGSRGNNADRSLNVVSGQQLMDVPPSSFQGWTVSAAGTDLFNLNAASNRLEYVNGLLVRMYSDAYSTSTVELDAAKGHIAFPRNAAPTPAPNTAAIGSAGNGSSVTISGNDTAGTITVTTASTGLGSFPATAADFTFASAFASTPRMVVTPINGASANLRPYAQAYSPTQFLLGFATAPATSTTYMFAYHVIG